MPRRGHHIVLLVLFMFFFVAPVARATPATVPARQIDVMVQVIKTVIGEAAKASDFKKLNPKQQYVAVLEAVKMLGFVVPTEVYQMGQNKVRAADLAALILTATDEKRRLRVLSSCAKFLQLATGQQLAALLGPIDDQKGTASPQTKLADSATGTRQQMANAAGQANQRASKQDKAGKGKPSQTKKPPAPAADIRQVGDLRDALVRKLIKSSERALQSIDAGQVPASIF